ncbi:MAG: hypothetical protein GTO45_31140 [Candidatus Aminicenantes bacterium]|nr:hypothetical protein [Candidatus Aminicenantes bacterium]NIM83254.1 hypothetical protein [Candidatus Aminicenantes bacterium]NIN22625.1 hypothetical protein [Candidatus Aminicenantes bacterium]NIN46384.1 hypothetical protein [Candidatus Aminicenantes bacterium]NIN89234.1 hypothetical protein [Candidatus Aminicenantes bacterium]
MKTKKFAKKLALNKKTIANLSDGHMGNVKGGDINTGSGHPPCEISCGCVTLKFTGCELCPTDTCNTCPATCNTCNYTCGADCTFKGTCDCPNPPIP